MEQNVKVAPPSQRTRLIDTARTIRLVLLLLIGLAGPAAMACQIPVFRYALENWEPDSYTLIVAHRGDLKESEAALVDELRQILRNQDDALNLDLTLVDLSRKKDPLLEEVLGKETESIQSPQIVLVYPFFHDLSVLQKSLQDEADPPITRDGLTAVPPGPTATGPGTPTLPEEVLEPHTIPPRLAWTGELSLENIRGLIDSPARRQIARRILDGQSAVWVLLDSGDRSQDDQAAATLQKALTQMQEELQLPDRQAIETDEHYQADTKVELKIEFSVVRIPVERGEETIFSSLLLNSEPELAAQKEPIAIPIFGRGRSFYALTGQGIRAPSIEDHCRFLVGDCSCQVKQLNPGTDMLFAIDWQKGIKGSALKEIDLPELSGIGPLASYEITPQTPSGDSKSEAGEIAAAIEETPVPAGSQKPNAPQAIPSEAATAATRVSDPLLPLSTVVLVLAGIGLIVILAGSLWLRRSRQF